MPKSLLYLARYPLRCPLTLCILETFVCVLCLRFLVVNVVGFGSTPVHMYLRLGPIELGGTYW